MNDMSQPKGHSSVMAMRIEDEESLDDFPTPPWATRALLEHVLWNSAKADLGRMWAWEPACGRRIMSDVLNEQFYHVVATDIASYEDEHCRAPDAIGSYLDMPPLSNHQWMITNPPFNKALEFVQKGLREAQCGVAVLVRSVWLESAERHRELFSQCPPTIVAQFVERVPMIKGVWNPRASTATGYAWVVWDCERKPAPGSHPRLMWIPPCREALTKADDDIRYGVRGLREWIAEQKERTSLEMAEHDTAAYKTDDPIKKAKHQKKANEAAKYLAWLNTRLTWLNSQGATRHD